MPQYRTSRQTHTFKHNHTYALNHFVIAHRTIACERHPERNEDSILVDENSALAGVFDGVGGSAAGEIASQTAAHAAHREWKQILEQKLKKDGIPTLFEHCDSLDLCNILETLIREADELVRTEGAKRAGTTDLATTVALAAFCRQAETRNYCMVYAHVGDSRVYLLRDNEDLKRLTNDDGLLAKLVENQVITEHDALRIDQAMRSEQLSDTEISYFRLRGGITQALGGPMPPLIHIDQITVQPGDRILLCTDGIHDNLTDDEIEQILRVSPRNAAARVLIERAIQRSQEERSMTVRAKPDDMSAIVMTCRF
jgi:PPM family protein phosphatase